MHHDAAIKRDSLTATSLLSRLGSTDRVVCKATGAVVNVGEVYHAAALELDAEGLLKRLVHEENLGILEDDVGSTVIRNAIHAARADTGENHLGGLLSTGARRAAIGHVDDGFGFEIVDGIPSFGVRLVVS